MQLVGPKRFSTPVRVVIAGILAASALFVALGMVGQSLPTVFSSSAPALSYWAIFAAFLVALLTSATAGGIGWGNKVQRRVGPLVFTLASWLMLASFFVGIVSIGFDDEQGEALWIGCLAAGSVGVIVAAVGLFMTAKRPSND